MVPAQAFPAPPESLAAIVAAASNPDVDVRQLSRLLERDSSFAAVVLKVANSSRFSSKVRTLHQAVSRLGVRALRNLALCQAARNCVNPKKIGGFDLFAYWQSSLQRAVAAELLFESRGLDGSLGFTIGLLQDLGVVVLVLDQPEHAETYSRSVAAVPLEQRAIEEELFGATHDAVTAPLVDLWNLPHEVAGPILSHHRPKTEEARLANLAEFIAAALTTAGETELEHTYVQLGAQIGLSRPAVDKLIDAVGARVKQAAAEQGFRVGPQPTVEQILRQTNRSLADANATYDELVTRLEQALDEKQRLATELEAANRELRRLVATDPLTGLANRRTYEERLSAVLSSQARRGGATSLLIADVDHFKQVNDTWGHSFGDEVLVAVALALREVARESDLVLRAGGEEFAFLLPNTDPIGAERVAQRALQSVRRILLTSPDASPVRVTMSIGSATLSGRPNLRPSMRNTAHALYNAADKAMYHAKHEGRNQIRVASQLVPWTG